MHFMHFNREQVMRTLNAFQGKQLTFVDHPSFKEPLPVKGVAMKDEKIIIYCDEQDKSPKEDTIDPVNISIYTDGACSGNPGPGGWAHVTLVERAEGPVQWENSGPSGRQTTNQRMEILAVLHALAQLNKTRDVSGCPITVYSDSEYLIKSMNGLYKKKANQDLWRHMDSVTDGLNIQWVHIKRDTHPLQIRCDELARKAISK